MILRALALALLVATPVVAQEGFVSASGATLRALDKVNGRTEDEDLLSGGGRALMGLEVELGDCRYPANNPTGEAYAFLTIREKGKTDILFQGWMVATSPALNPLDHSRYDVWVLRCMTS